MKTSHFFFDPSKDFFIIPNLSSFYVLDQGLIIRFWSKTTEEKTGVVKEDAIGKNIMEIKIPYIERQIPLIKKSYKNEKQISYVEKSNENWFSTSILPEEEYLFVLTRDITEYKNSERESTNLQLIKRHMLNSLKDAIWTIEGMLSTFLNFHPC